MMTSERPILRDVFPDWNDQGGIFYELNEMGVLPWSQYVGPDGFGISPVTLDIAYFANHSGSKFCSPMVCSMLNSDGVLSPTSIHVLASVLSSKYIINWYRLWDTMATDYTPFYNYDLYEERELVASKDETKVTDGSVSKTGTDTMAHGRIESTEYSDSKTEAVDYGRGETVNHGKTVTDALQHGETETVTHGKGVTDTTAHGKTETTSHGKTVTENISKFGFNGGDSNPAPSDRDVSAETGSTGVTMSGSDTETIVESGTTGTAHSGTDTRSVTEGGSTSTVESGGDETSIEAEGDRKVTNSGSDVETKNLLDETDITETLDHDAEETEEIHRYGNIGVTTTQKLVQEERELWIWSFFDQVFADLDNELALAFHDPCRV